MVLGAHISPFCCPEQIDALGTLARCAQGHGTRVCLVLVTSQGKAAQCWAHLQDKVGM